MNGRSTTIWPKFFNKSHLSSPWLTICLTFIVALTLSGLAWAGPHHGYGGRDYGGPHGGPRGGPHYGHHRPPPPPRWNHHRMPPQPRHFYGYSNYPAVCGYPLPYPPAPPGWQVYPAGPGFYQYYNLNGLYMGSCRFHNRNKYILLTPRGRQGYRVIDLVGY